MLKEQLAGLRPQKGSGPWLVGQRGLKMVEIGQKGKPFVKVDQSQPVVSSMADRTLKPQRMMGLQSVRTVKL